MAECQKCGGEFKPTSNSSGKFCSHACYGQARATLPRSGACAECGKSFVYTRNQRHLSTKGRVFCSSDCRSRSRKLIPDEIAATLKGKSGPIRGPCATCGCQYRAYGSNRKFCSVPCYVKSPEFAARNSEHNRRRMEQAAAKAGVSVEDALKNTCRHCGCGFEVESIKKRRQFCTHQCRRSFYAERFDRWIADPKTIALPQAYDEFLAGELVECPVDGCGWEGQSLGMHCNLVHGISADVMRKLMGFNRSTGLCTARVSDERAEVARRIGLSGLAGPIENAWASKGSRGGIRPEGREKLVKVGAILRVATRESTCVGCGDAFTHSQIGRHLWCSLKCRDAHYLARSRKHEMSCSVCSREFLGRAEQVVRVSNGEPVYCDKSCSARGNWRARREAAKC